MWKTIKYSKNGRPLIDVNEQGVFYSYRSKNLKSLRFNRKNNSYLCWVSADGKVHYAHIEVAKAFPEICGEWYEGCEVHHKDGNRLNNEATNLLVCSKEEHSILHNELKSKKKFDAIEENIDKEAEFNKVLEEFRKNGYYTTHCYCKKKNERLDGLAPIEVRIYQNYRQYCHQTRWLCRPALFEQGIYPEGFEAYVQSIKNNYNA